MGSLSVAAVLLLEIIYFIECKICSLRPITIIYQDGDADNETTPSWERTPQPDYSCPRTGDPYTFTECCVDAVGIPMCCASHHQRRFYEIDNTLAMIIAACVISCCAVLAVLFIVCCFWSKCPLYNTCRVRYMESEVLAFDKEPDSIGLNNMPAEPNHQSKHQIFAHNNVNTGSVAAV